MSFSVALPLLLISMCAFLGNDLDDIEGDKISHPDRPLPSGRLGPATAVVLFFLLLFSALISIREAAPHDVANWYYVLLTLLVSYNYITEHLPNCKSLYVSSLCALPVVILGKQFDSEPRLQTLAAGMFLFAFAREICMDFIDQEGDRPSFVRNLGSREVGGLAFSSQATALLLLAPNSLRFPDFVILPLICLLSSWAAKLWFLRKNFKMVVHVMKAEFFLGLGLLI